MFAKLRPSFRRTETEDVSTSPVAMTSVEEDKRDPATTEAAIASSSQAESQTELPDEDLQRGVQDVEAVTLNWSKGSLIAVFIKYVLAPACQSKRALSSHL